MGFFSVTSSDLAAILAADGEALTHTTRDDVTATAFTSMLHPNGDEGAALVYIPAASIAAPVFGDKITGADSDTWRIYEVKQKSQGATPCDLKHTDYWKTVDIEFYNDAKVGGAGWDTHTESLLMVIESVNGDEIETTEGVQNTTAYECHCQDLNSITERMRIVNGNQILYIHGIEPDTSQTRRLLITAVDKQA